jgi:hypothetical protein
MYLGVTQIGLRAIHRLALRWKGIAMNEAQANTTWRLELNGRKPPKIISLA